MFSLGLPDVLSVDDVDRTVQSVEGGSRRNIVMLDNVDGAGASPAFRPLLAVLMDCRTVHFFVAALSREPRLASVHGPYC